MSIGGGGITSAFFLVHFLVPASVQALQYDIV